MAALRLIAAIIAAFALLTVAPLADAAPKEAAAAKKASKEGQKLEKKGKWEEARDAYRRALELDDAPGHKLRLAGAEQELGHLMDALALYREVQKDKRANFAEKTKARNAIKKLDKKLPKLELDMPSDFAGTVSVDDREVADSERKEPIPLEAGEHTVRAESEGFTPFEQKVELKEGATEKVTILLEPVAKAEPTAEPIEDAPPPPPEEEKKKKGGSTGKTLGFISLGVGVVGVGVGTFFALKSSSTRDELDGACPNDVCSAEDRELYDRGKQQADLATVGFVVGGVGLGVGMVLLLSGSSSSSAEPGAETARAPRIVPVVGPGAVGVRGNF